MDYVHDTLKVPYSYLLELPPSKRSVFGFALPKEEIESVSDEVFCSMLITFKRIDEIIAAQNSIPTAPPTTPSTTTTTPTTTTTVSTTTTTTASKIHKTTTKHSHRTVAISARSVIDGNF